MNATMTAMPDQPDLWGGPNYDGWEFELTNTTDHDLVFVADITANVASYPPPRIAAGATAFLKGKKPRQGWSGEL